ncbi:VOC family protein [Crossiella sp. NPDC003009]
MPRAFQVVVDCRHPDLMAEFWAYALDYRVQDPPDGQPSWLEFQRAKGFPPEEVAEFASVVEPDGDGRICFLGVPEGKQGKNRLHLDIQATAPGDDLAEKIAKVDALVARLCARGGTVARTGRERGQYFVTMADVEGNEFCVH